MHGALAKRIVGCGGVVGQVMPDGLQPLLTGPDAAARERTFAALLGMGKLDLAELRRAYDGI